jgi:hypothetical protein
MHKRIDRQRLDKNVMANPSMLGFRMMRYQSSQLGSSRPMTMHTVRPRKRNTFSVTLYGAIVGCFVCWIGHELEDSGVRIPAKARKLFFSKTYRLLLALTQHLIQRGLNFLSALRRLRRGGDLALHLSTDIKNKWRYSSKTPISQHGVDRNTFTFNWLVLLSYETTAHSAYLTINITQSVS